jgi:hypothetical protein
VITGVTEITEICTKQDMSRWTRAHADAPGITWSVIAGPGGTMIIVEHLEDRCSRTAAQGAAQAAPQVMSDAAVAPSVLAREAERAGARMVDSFVKEWYSPASTYA